MLIQLCVPGKRALGFVVVVGSDYIHFAYVQWQFVVGGKDQREEKTGRAPKHARCKIYCNNRQSECVGESGVLYFLKYLKLLDTTV
jgi:hypothetical protein